MDLFNPCQNFGKAGSIHETNRTTEIFDMTRIYYPLEFIFPTPRLRLYENNLCYLAQNNAQDPNLNTKIKVIRIQSTFKSETMKSV